MRRRSPSGATWVSSTAAKIDPGQCHVGRIQSATAVDAPGSILGILDNTAIALQIDKDVAFDSPKQASAAKVIERACAVATEQVQCIPAERRATCSSRFGLLARRGNAEGSRHT